MKMVFQHSQPQSVYRQKNRALIGALIPLSLVMIGVYGYQFLERPRASGLFVIAMWLFNLANSIQMFLRIKLTMSPAGISVMVSRSVATTWANVESIQLIRLGYLIKSDVPCLVLREPVQSKLWQAGRAGVPAELKGRIIPIHPSVWGRIFTLEEELYGYLKANSVIRNELAVPINLAAAGDRLQKVAIRFVMVMVAVMVVPMMLLVFMLLR